MILACSSICKAFGGDEILKNVSFHIEEHEKAAIVGINGAGKSTLLKIIVGELPADSGEVVISKGKTLGYLAQNQDLLSHRTIYDEMVEATSSSFRIYWSVGVTTMQASGLSARRWYAAQATAGAVLRLAGSFRMFSGGSPGNCWLTMSP